MGTSVRTVTGIVFVPPPTVCSTIDRAASPESLGLVAVNVAVAVAPGEIVNVDGTIPPADAYSEVVARHWIGPAVPTRTLLGKEDGGPCAGGRICHLDMAVVAQPLRDRVTGVRTVRGV